MKTVTVRERKQSKSKSKKTGFRQASKKAVSTTVPQPQGATPHGPAICHADGIRNLLAEWNDLFPNQRETAEFLGFSAGYLSRLLNGHGNPGRKIAGLLGYETRTEFFM